MQNQLPSLDDIKRKDGLGREYWSARDLMLLLGYGEDGWYAFEKVIEKAMRSCANRESFTEDHFHQVAKMMQADSDAKQEIIDYFVTSQVS